MAFHRPREARSKMSVGERRQKPFESGGSKSAGRVWLVEDAKEGGRQIVATARIDDEARHVVLDDLRQPPYSARIEFEKIYANPADHTELKRERWTASATYVFRDVVQNNESAVNPLGLTIVRFRADQAFS